MAEETLKDQVFTHVLYGIITGEYLADTIVNEKKLCEKLQVSKSPVREALVDLCSQGILRSKPRHGYVVVRYTERNIRDIVQYRTLIECGCLEQCFENITATQICTLSDLVEHEFSFLSQKDTLDYWHDTLNFHLTLISFTGNEFIYNQLKASLTSSMRAYLQFYWGKCEDPSLLQPSVLHKKIVQCLKSGDKVSALQYLKEDVESIFAFKDFAK